jgi:hypothetical protein
MQKDRVCFGSGKIRISIPAGRSRATFHLVKWIDDCDAMLGNSGKGWNLTGGLIGLASAQPFRARCRLILVRSMDVAPRKLLPDLLYCVSGAWLATSVSRSFGGAIRRLLGQRRCGFGAAWSSFRHLHRASSLPSPPVAAVHQSRCACSLRRWHRTVPGALLVSHLSLPGRHRCHHPRHSACLRRGPRFSDVCYSAPYHAITTSATSADMVECSGLVGGVPESHSLFSVGGVWGESQLPAPPPGYVVSLFCLFLVVAPLVCGTVVWQSKLSVRWRVGWLVLTVFGMSLQVGALLLFIFAAIAAANQQIST